MKTKTFFIVFLFIILLVSDVQANLIVNGSFENGNYGYTTGYIYDNNLGDEGIYDSGKYCIGTDPSNTSIAWPSFGDHTTGSGKMMIVNGNSNGTTTVW